MHLRYRFVSHSALAALLLALTAPFASAQPVPGFSEEFAGASLGGFSGGSQLNNPGTGGVGGAGDGFLRINTVAASNFGAHSALSAAYAGDYTVAGVDQIRVWLNDVGTDQNFLIHLAIGNTSNMWQHDAGFAPPNGSWGEYIVPLNGPTGWTRIVGLSGTFAEALQTADRILLRHDLAPYVSNPNTIQGDCGVDRIQLRSSVTPAASNSWGRIKQLYR